MISWSSEFRIVAPGRARQAFGVRSKDMSQVERMAIFERWTEIHYDQFPQQPIFAPSAVIRSGVTEQDYEDVRIAYASLMAGVELQDSAYRRGCLPILMIISIIGIPIFMYLQNKEGLMRRRARNAAILAFRAIANREDHWPQYLMAQNRDRITTKHFSKVF